MGVTMLGRFGSRLVCLTVVGATLVCGQNVGAQEQSYWLRRGPKNVIKCPGNTTGIPVKMVNPPGQWIVAYGVVICKSSGQNYVYNVKFVKVEINKERISDIERDPLRFDWLGLAVYGPAEGGRRINWLYSKAFPIRGEIGKANDGPIIFGNIEFTVAHSAVEQASNFAFYFWAEGIPFVFGAM
jgi:hypothetical protein